jgi:hypothetical protein
MNSPHFGPAGQEVTRRYRWVTFAVLCCIGLTGAAAFLYFYVRFQVQPLRFVAVHPFPAELIRNGRATVRCPAAVFATRVATFRDELFAYMMYQHYRSSSPFRNDELLLRYAGDGGEAKYHVLVVLTNDYIASVERVAELHSTRQIEGFEWRLLSQVTLTAYRNQTSLFHSAYNLPVRRTMEELPKSELRALLRRFIRFKSTTDPRVRGRMEPVPSVLSSEDAHRLAGDIIAVAEFYDLPLEYLLGIGAMENNYMVVRGDLQHSIWKRRPHPMT